jgi:hypothetical protein
MTFDRKVEKKIKNLLREFINDVIKRSNESFDYEMYKKERPFHAALLPEIVCRLSSFERSFSTSLGQKIFETIAYEIANSKYYGTKRQKELRGKISLDENETIMRIIDGLEDRRRKPNWDMELSEIANANILRKDEEGITKRVTSDIYIEDFRNKKALFCEIKSPKPNKDQSEKSLEKMLTIHTIYKYCDTVPLTYFALPFNPFIKRSRYAHSFPMIYFDIRAGKNVVIGREFWDMIGGNGTWEQLITVFQEEGDKTRDLILKRK